MVMYVCSKHVHQTMTSKEKDWKVTDKMVGDEISYTGLAIKSENFFGGNHIDQQNCESQHWATCLTRFLATMSKRTMIYLSLELPFHWPTQMWNMNECRIKSKSLCKQIMAGKMEFRRATCERRFMALPTMRCWMLDVLSTNQCLTASSQTKQ